MPSLTLALHTRWPHRGGLVAGWFAGMATGLLLLDNIPKPDPDGSVAREHLGGSSSALATFGLGTKPTVSPGPIALPGEPAGTSPIRWSRRPRDRRGRPEPAARDRTPVRGRGPGTCPVG
ncbi:MAG: sodium:solute symporter [Blastococcus sp.]|nr:sodium:solute symporter [Blastococcus sp.]